ncbi:acetylcholine receptor subunit beta-type acr-3-like [Procambarus clarkii]|uniref:acetylcholine receptor subunit beta-type acr-3-like n=1 Tax=Procambarus clarkii TaxID=6728 RepID=UPI003743270A
MAAFVAVWATLLSLLAAFPIIKGQSLPGAQGPSLQGAQGPSFPEAQDARYMSAEHRLFEYLFSKYNKHVRPIEYSGEITNVFFELSIFNILAVDTKLQQMTTNTEMIMKWKDFHLRWDPGLFNGTTSIRIPYKSIWYPDIILTNTATGDYEGSVLNTNAIINYLGEVELMSHAILTTVCLMDVQWYPFDQQTCSLAFSSWTYDNSKIRLVQGPADLSKFRQNPEFFLEDFYSKLEDIINPCCPIPMSTIRYYLQVQRRTIFSLFFFIMPGILINFCALMVFSLPAESGEKIGLGINSMLAMMVFLMAMTDNLPPTEKLPLAGVYYGACISMIALNIALSVTVLNLNVMGMRGYQVPEFLKTVTLVVARAIIVRIPIIVRKAWNISEKSKTITRVQKLKDKMHMSGNTVKVFNVLPQTPKTQELPEVKQHFEDDLNHTVLTDPFQRRAIAVLESINKILTREQEERDVLTVRNTLVEEWKFVSRVMDRTLFLTFTLITFIFNVSILTSSPFRERFAYCPLGDNGECDDLTWEQIIEITSHAANDIHFSGTKKGHTPAEASDAAHLQNNHAYITNIQKIPEVAYDGFDDPPPDKSAAPYTTSQGIQGSAKIRKLDSPDHYDEPGDLDEDHSPNDTSRNRPQGG